MQDNPNTEGCFVLEKQPLIKRIVNRFFEWHNTTSELPSWAKDGVVIVVDIDLSIKDRILILLTGRASLKTWTACENIPGRISTELTSFKVRPNKIFEY